MSARALALVHALFLVGITTTPFVFYRGYALPDLFSRGSALLTWRTTPLDLIANVALFVPLGVVLRRGEHRAVLLGAGLSMLIELLQLLSPVRSTCLYDLLANAAGAGLGAALCLRLDAWRGTARPWALILPIWLAGMRAPWLPSAGLEVWPLLVWGLCSFERGRAGWLGALAWGGLAMAPLGSNRPLLAVGALAASVLARGAWLRWRKAACGARTSALVWALCVAPLVVRVALEALGGPRWRGLFGVEVVTLVVCAVWVALHEHTS